MSDLERYLTDDMIHVALRASDSANEGGVVGGRERMMRAALSAVLPVIIRQAKAEAWDEGRSMSELTWRHIYDGHDEPGVEVVTKEARR